MRRLSVITSIQQQVIQRMAQDLTAASQVVGTVKCSVKQVSDRKSGKTQLDSTQMFSWVASCDVNVLTTQLNSTEFVQFFGINISRPCPVELG
jgi:hypothetical protein